MHAFDVLGDPVRRRILELLAEEEQASGEVVEVISSEFGITQSAISQQIRRLEQELGVEVFRRTSRSVELTDEGRVILGYAQRVLAEVDGRGKHDDVLAALLANLQVPTATPTVSA